MLRRAITSLITPLKPLYLYSQPASDIAIRNQQTIRKQFNQYFTALSPEVEKECGPIIRELGKERPDIPTIAKLLDAYLSVTIDPSNRSVKGVFSVFCALNMVQLEALGRFKRGITELTSRLNVQDVKLSPLEVNYYISNDNQFRSGVSEKNKADSKTMHLMQIVDYNFQNVEPEHYGYLLQIIRYEEKLQLRFRGIAWKLQDSICKILFRLNNKEYIDSRQARMLSDRFMENFNMILTIYGANSPQNMQTYYHYIIHFYLKRKWGEIARRNLAINTIYRHFIYYTTDKDGVYYKEKLLKEIISIFLKDKQSIDAFAHTMSGFYLCSSILTYQLYHYGQSVMSKLIKQGSFSYLPRSQIPPKPELPAIFWQIYKCNPQAVNYVSYVDHLLKEIYPQHYIVLKGDRVETKEPVVQTEMKIRVEQALISLKLDYKSQCNISGKFIDFLIEDKIILEIDGMHHFRLGTMQPTDKTQMRNAHMILKGYQMIVINIYEYNIARELQELKELLMCKIQTAKLRDAALLL